MLTDKWLVKDVSRGEGGVRGSQRIYRFPNGFGLSLVDGEMLHGYSFAWEAAVVTGVTEDGDFEGITYDTTLTGDVEVFMSDEDTNEFIERAATEIGGA